MDEYSFECQATNFQHSCKYTNATEEPTHPLEMSLLIDKLTPLLDDLEYSGIIKSPSNSYQINFDYLDTSLINLIAHETDWHNKTLSLKEFPKGMQIKPDGILDDGKTTIGLEIEKSNKKTIWFDFIKLMMLIDLNKINYGFLFLYPVITLIRLACGIYSMMQDITDGVY